MSETIERATAFRDGMIDVARALSAPHWGATQSDMREAQIEWVAQQLADADRVRDAAPDLLAALQQARNTLKLAGFSTDKANAAISRALGAGPLDICSACSGCGFGNPQASSDRCGMCDGMGGTPASEGEE